MRRGPVLVALFMVCHAAIVFSQDTDPRKSFVPSFDLRPNDLKLSRLAQPTQYFDKIGRKAGIMGYESGQCEMWIWPWKVLRNFDLQFLLGTSTEPILASEVVRTITVTPEVTTLTYTYESFTVKEHIIVPRREPGAILLLDVHTTTPLTIIPGFIPVMQPMWPAGIGGQYSYWDDEAKAYVISEGQQRGLFLLGSPAGKQMAAPPAHMFSDHPLQFRIDLNPGETEGSFIPVIIAGGPVDSETQKMRMDPVKEVYAKLWKHAQMYYEECYDYYRNLRASTLQIQSTDKDITLACEWGKVALDNLMVENPKLGYGMVAGFGLSGGGERPGFAWFFGGDAFINSLAMNSLGMFQQSHDALAFTQRWQRQENYPVRKKHPGDPPTDVGKMAHELSQSEGLCDWWNDYHYGYNHADTSPWYIVAMGDYVRTSGDTSFLRQSWGSVKQAYTWCLSKDSDGDGLMDLKGAGLGALEFGKLVGIYADVYTSGVFVQAVAEMRYMADLMHDSLQAAQARVQLSKAKPRLEKLFWLDPEGYYAYGATARGEQVREKTPWSGVAMMFGLLDEGRTEESMEAFNGADLCTDWGVRTLSNRSTLFEPTNYNYGAVWPFIASFFNTAQFKHHFALAGYQILRANLRHVFDHGLGVVPEVFSGELNEKLGEGYHHQGFSTTGYILPLVRGLLGLEVDGVQKYVHVSPHVPAFAFAPVELRHLMAGSDTVNMTLGGMPRGGKRSYLEIDVTNSGHDTLSVAFNPSLDAGSTVTSVSSPRPGTPDESPGSPVPFTVQRGSQDEHVALQFTVSHERAARIEYQSPGYVGLPESPSLAGDSLTDAFRSCGSANSGLRFISERREHNDLVIVLEGLSGASYGLDLAVAPGTEVQGARSSGGRCIVTFEGMSPQQFLRKEIRVRFK